MSNTGRNKKLASFNCDEELWGEFICRCQEQGTTATATLTQFIQLYLDGKLDNLNAGMLGDAFGGSRSDHRFDALTNESAQALMSTWRSSCRHIWINI